VSAEPPAGSGLPADWADRLARVPATARPEDLVRFAPPPEGGRQSAVLVLFGTGPHEGADGSGPHVLLTQRADTIRSHAGQVSFPGGALDPTDAGPVAAALREAAEETGLDPAGVEVIGELPAQLVPASEYVVTPVLALWREPSPVAPMDPAEVAHVVRVPLEELLDPANRCTAHHPSGNLGPAFTVQGLFVWGFTAWVLSQVLAVAGLERPWPVDRVVELPADVLALLP